ncbi:hypothetical protein CEP51_011082 [Fusarium floridanum]|uniref:Zn(2)-C6 fungal-type domain-containing protein n=1 Tax=Fusarium floridanum TaxID=1325733 RepID=A0A428RCG0_9HYPO|nr:hypothetical protein CEP51_011082 [Fusarium floridanum]
MSARYNRRMGACLQCSQRKRKCDHKHPRCSQCLKSGQICEPKTFRSLTPSAFGTERWTEQLSGSSPPSEPPNRDDGRELSHVQQSLLPTFDTPLYTLDGHQEAFTEAGHALCETPIRPSVSSDLTLGHLPQTISHDSNTPGPGSFPEPWYDSPVSITTFLTQSHISAKDTANEENSPPGGMVVGIPEFSPLGASPAQLYCPMPWPDDMLESPERRFLWQYFLFAAETDFLCLDWEDVGHLYAYQHPYITNLPYMALSNTALRGAILCFSAAQYQLRFQRQDFIVTKGVTCSEAVRSMEIQLAGTTRDEGNLLSIVYAATLLYAFGPERHDYLRIASQLVIEFLGRWNPEANTSKSYPEITLTEYRWTVICTLCSLQKPNPALGDRICHMIEMGEDEIEQKYSDAFQSWVSHPIYTFSPRLINPLLRIGRLLQIQLSQLDAGPDHELPLTWESRVTETEEILLQARERDANVSESALGGADPAAVLALNESMYAASSILLYARIHGLPFTAPFIRRQTRIVVEEISKIQPTSHVSYAIVFPLFIAGCEAVEPQVRDVVEERLREPRGISYNRGDVIGALHRIWEIRDLEPGLPWPLWVDKEPRYRDICLM